MLSRVIGAARLDPGTYEQVEADPGANLQAAAVVIVSSTSVAIGIGATEPFRILVFVAYLTALWVFVSGAAWIIGTEFFDGDAEWGELLRTMGFAQGPAVLMMVAAVPGLQLPTVLVVSVWLGMTYVAALTQALDIEPGKALATGGICLGIMLLSQYLGRVIWG
jgi:hypothetical protein